MCIIETINITKMATITTILGTDSVSSSRVTLNDNFAAINQELVGIDYKYPFGRGKYSIPHKVRDKRTHTIAEKNKSGEIRAPRVVRSV